MIKIFASTTGWGGVGVTLRVSVNTAPDGSSNGEWRILKELGVPKFNEVDAPEWHTNGWSNGTYRIRVEAKGPGDPHWQNPAVIESTYTLVGKSVISEEVIEEITEGPYTVCSPFILPVDNKYLETAGVSRGKGIMTSAYFFLEPGAEIKAVISGRITRMIHNSKPFKDCPAFENFFLEDENGIFCSYLLLGKTMVEEGDKVSQGQIIAISSGGDFGFHLGNLQIYTEQRFGEGPNDYKCLDLLR
jgi:murein DD-endopeptidase MepM/ murein hydrolase activator NlpD